MLSKVCTSGRGFSSTWCKRTVETLRGDGQQPVLGATAQQVGPVLCSLRCSHTLSIGWEFAVDAWSVRIPRERVDAGPGCARHKSPRSRFGHLTVKRAGQSVKEYEAQAATGDETLCQRRQCWTNAEMNSVSAVTRQSYIAAHDAPVAWVGTQQLRLGADHATLDRVLVRNLDEELFEEGESAAVARLTLFGTISCRGDPRHPHIMSRCRHALRRFVRDEPGFAKDPLPLEALVILASDLLKQHRLFGQTSVPCACNVVRPLQAAIRNVEKISSRDVICTSSAEIPVSVSHHCAERCCKREQHNPRKAASSTTQSWQACRASTNS